MIVSDGSWDICCSSVMDELCLLVVSSRQVLQYFANGCLATVSVMRTLDMNVRFSRSATPFYWGLWATVGSMLMPNVGRVRINSFVRYSFALSERNRATGLSKSCRIIVKIALMCCSASDLLF